MYSHIYPKKYQEIMNQNGWSHKKEGKHMKKNQPSKPQALIAFLDQVADVIFHLGIFGSLIDLSMVRAPRRTVDGHLWAQLHSFSS